MRARALVASTLLVAALAAGCGGDDTSSPAGIIRQPAPDVSNVSLPDASTGDRFITRADPGEILVVYFGYTSCPDICPTTLADLRFAVRNLGDDAERIDAAMVTVDPGRDDGERLTAYVQSFVEGAHALRTDDPAELQASADSFGVSYSVSTTADGYIEVTHSAFLYAVDSAGHIRVQWPFGTSSEDLERDLAYLLEEGRGFE
jgi:protein SCO1/2